MSNVVKLNGQEITPEKLQEEIKKAESQKGIKIVEVAPGEYKKLLQD